MPAPVDAMLRLEPEPPLPTALTAVLWAVDRPLDMCRTVVNVWSDTMGTTAIAHKEGLIDEPSR